MIDRLQVTQSGRVGGGDVDDDEVDPVGQRLRAVLVVGRGVLFGGHFVLADVGAHDGGAARGRRAKLAQLVGGCVRASVVEAHTVAQAALFHEAPQTRGVVAGLGARGDGSDFDEGVAEGTHAEHGLRIFVHPGREAQTRGQTALSQRQGDLDSVHHPGGAVVGIEVAQCGAHESARRGESAGQRNCSQTQVVCIFRVGT